MAALLPCTRMRWWRQGRPNREEGLLTEGQWGPATTMRISRPKILMKSAKVVGPFFFRSSVKRDCVGCPQRWCCDAGHQLFIYCLFWLIQFALNVDRQEKTSLWFAATARATRPQKDTLQRSIFLALIYSHFSTINVWFSAFASHAVANQLNIPIIVWFQIFSFVMSLDWWALFSVPRFIFLTSTP